MLFAVIAYNPATAQTAVDLQLVLAVDVSGSVNAQRFELQKMGYVAAFLNKKVLNAIVGGRNQAIAVTMAQWSGPFLQAQVVPWTLLKDESTIKAVAGMIESATLARDEAVKAGLVINGLPILAFEPFLDQYFKDYVIGGPGAFMIAAKSFETFAEAILMKLIIEIADVGARQQHAGVPRDGAAIFK